MSDFPAQFSPSDLVSRWSAGCTKCLKGNGYDEIAVLFADNWYLQTDSGPGKLISKNLKFDFAVDPAKETGDHLTWEAFIKSAAESVAKDYGGKYEKTVGTFLGALGNRMLVEDARYDADGKKIFCCIQLWHIGKSGKIEKAELFANGDMAKVLNQQLFNQ